MAWMGLPEPLGQEEFHRLAQHFVSRIAEQPLGLGVDEDDGAGLVDHDNRIRRRLQQVAMVLVRTAARSRSQCVDTDEQRMSLFGNIPLVPEKRAPWYFAQRESKKRAKILPLFSVRGKESWPLDRLEKQALPSPFLGLLPADRVSRENS